MKRVLFTTILFTIFTLIISSCNNKTNTSLGIISDAEVVTLYGTEFLKGKVSSLVYNDEQGCDSLAFVYDKMGNIDKVIYYSNDVEAGYCKYEYRNSNRVDQYNFNYQGVEKSYEIVEFNDKKKITLYREYGYIYPDTTRMQLLYLKQNSYDIAGRKESAFEYHCDGIPPYNYRYTYDHNGTEIEECRLTVTGDIYAIIKTKRDSLGNIIEQNENMPWDNNKWDSIKVEYKYDNKGNWTEYKVTSLSSQEYLNREAKRKIYYIDNE